MMERYVYELELMEEIPQEVAVDKVREMSTEQEWYGHAYADPVGRIYADGHIESFVPHDGTGAEWFSVLRNAGVLKARRRNLKIKHKVCICEEYYLQRSVIGHSSTLPTVVNGSLTANIRTQNRYTYEVLLVADDEYRRYITCEMTVRTSGRFFTGLCEDLNGLILELREWATEGRNGFSKKHGKICCCFYNDFGEARHIYFSSQELLLHVNSVRIIKLNKEYVNKETIKGSDDTDG